MYKIVVTDLLKDICNKKHAGFINGLAYQLRLQRVILQHNFTSQAQTEDNLITRHFCTMHADQLTEEITLNGLHIKQRFTDIIKIKYRAVSCSHYIFHHPACQFHFVMIICSICLIFIIQSYAYLRNSNCHFTHPCFYTSLIYQIFFPNQ